MTIQTPGADDDDPRDMCTEGCDEGQCGCDSADVVVLGTCHTCDGELDWEECDVCGGEDGSSSHDVSPVEYDEDDWDECDQCDGQGGWSVCPACRSVAAAPKERTNA